MEEKMQDKSDSELLKIIVESPTSRNANSAREVLEYRKHVTAKRHNSWLLTLSIILSIAAVLQTIVAIMKYG